MQPMDIAISVAGVPIRLTHERWFHIAKNHDDMAGYYEDVPDLVESPEAPLSRSSRHPLTLERISSPPLSQRRQYQFIDIDPARLRQHKAHSVGNFIAAQATTPAGLVQRHRIRASHRA